MANEGIYNGVTSSVIKSGGDTDNSILYNFTDNSAKDLLGGNSTTATGALDPRVMYSSYKSVDGTPYKNPYIEFSHDKSLFGLENGTWNQLGTAAGLAGTAYNLYDNILGNKADMYKLQKSALQQNMANVAEDRANHQAFQKNLGGGFNSAMGSGLASSAVKA